MSKTITFLLTFFGIWFFDFSLAAFATEQASHSALIQSIIKDRKFELSDAKTSVSDRFSFVIDASIIRHGNVVKMYDIYVCRDKERSAALIRYANGMPHAYLTDGFYVVYEPATQQLRFGDSGFLRLRFERKDRAFNFDIAFVDRKADAGIFVDPGSLAEPFDAARSVAYDPLGPTLTLATENTNIQFRLSPPSDPTGYCVREFAISRGDLTVSLGQVTIDVAPTIDILHVEGQKISKLGVPLVRNAREMLNQLTALPGANALPPKDSEVLRAFATLFPTCREVSGSEPSVASTFIHSSVKGGELSSLQTSVSDRFSFLFEILKIREGKASKIFDVYVCRDKDRSAALVRYPDGLPYAYITEGLLIVCDPEEERLRISEQGYLRFRFERKQGFSFVLEYTPRKDDAGVFVDPDALVDPGQKTRLAEYDPIMRRLHVSTDNTKIQVQLVPQNDRATYQIQKLMIIRKDVVGSLRSIVIDARPAIDLLNIRRRDVNRLELPILVMNERDPIQPTPVGINLVEDKQRAIAKKLSGLFPIQP